MIKALLIGVGSLLAFFLPFLKRENDKLNEQLKQNEELLKDVKKTNEIQSSNSKLSKSELVDKL